MKLGLALMCTAVLGTACSSSSSPSGPAVGDGGEAGAIGDAGGDGGGLADGSSGDAVADGASAEAGGDAGDGAVACNTLANTAPQVTGAQVAENPPAMQGGTVVDGTYFLTNLTIYTGPEGPTGATGMTDTTIQITGNTIQVVTNGTPGTRTETFAGTGSTFTATDTCPDTTVIQGAYTATSSSFVVQFPGGTDDAGARTVEETFAKQ
jgi:hypothetical protein